MYINKVSDYQNFKGLSIEKFLHQAAKPKQYKYMEEACYKLSGMIGQPTSRLQLLTKGADIKQYNFLKTMANKFNNENFRHINDNSDHILNIYSMVQRPTSAHMNIVNHTKDSFEALEKIFALATDEKSLEFVQTIQQNILKDSPKSSKIITEMLSSANREKYVAKPQNYSSYLKLYSEEENAVSKLDELVSSGKYSKFRFDAQAAIKKLMRKKNVEAAMAGKTSDLEKMYTKERANFLKSLIKNFIPARKAPQEETKSIVVNMYGTLDSTNAKLRNAIVDRFKNTPLKDRTAEIVEMQKLFAKIDNDQEAKKFVQKAITKDLKIGSIAELNEVLETTPLKKANIFFNNAKRIIERSTGEERKTALVVQLENPFFESKAPKTGRARIVRMFADRPQQDDFFTRMAKIIENKINQYRYSRLSA